MIFPFIMGIVYLFVQEMQRPETSCPKLKICSAKSVSNVVQLMKSDWLLGLPFGSFNLMLKAFGSARKDLFQTLDLHDAIPKSQQYQSISISTSMYRYIVMGQNPGTLLFTPKYFANAWLLIFQEWFDKH